MEGSYEYEVLGNGPEAEESWRAWESCTKNPGHTSFIPLAQFTRADLPQEVRDGELLSATKLMARLVVRLRVNFTSPERPNYISPQGLCLGTGCIFKVEPAHSFTFREPAYKNWRIYVSTARHVVYNTAEAAQTRVDLFYDDESALTDGRVKTLQGKRVIQAFHEPNRSDWCEFVCHTNDEVLAGRLMNYLLMVKPIPFNDNSLMDTARRIGQDFAQLRVRYNPLEVILSRVEDDIDTLWAMSPIRADGQKAMKPAAKRPPDVVVMVSHPHGQAKQVTIGRSQLADQTDNVFYSTDTCNGSSGAPFLCSSNLTFSAAHVSGEVAAPGNNTVCNKGNYKRLFRYIRDPNQDSWSVITDQARALDQALEGQGYSNTVHRRLYLAGHILSSSLAL